MYIVCWMKEKGNSAIEKVYKDKYRVFIENISKENKENAEKFYKKVLNKKDTYSVNLCKIIKSSDY